MKDLSILIKNACSIDELEKLKIQVINDNTATRDKDLEEIDAAINEMQNSDTSGEETEKSEAIKRVGETIKLLIGDRSIRRTAADSKVTAPYITAILKGKYLPSPEILKKLAAPEAKPQNAVTLEDLMVAAGYQTNYAEDIIIEGDVEAEINYDQSSDTNNDRLMEYATRLRPPRDNYRERRLERARYESLVTGVLYRCLSEKGIHFSTAEDNTGVRGYKPDMAILVPKQSTPEWWFKIFHAPQIHERNGIFMVRQLLGRLIFIEPKPERKLSLVISNEDVFKIMMGYKDKLAYRGDLSVILIDENNLSVIQEEYIAHYNEQDKGQEFYLV